MNGITLFALLACTGSSDGPDLHSGLDDTDDHGGDGGDGGYGGDGGDGGGPACEGDGGPRLDGELGVDAAWGAVRGEVASGRAGKEVGVADLDGDGVDELLVGAPNVDNETGVAYVVSAEGGEQALTQAAWLEVEGTDPRMKLGTQLVGGDFDGDGVAELAAGAPGAGGGAVLLTPTSGASWSVGASGQQSGLGSVLAAVDLDRDGVDEAVAADDDLGTGKGVVVLPTAAGTTADASVVWTSGGDSVSALASAGDTDGDGVEELLVGAEGAGNGRVWLAQAGGGDLADALAIDSDGTMDSFGTTVTSLGDFDGDGLDDVAVGSNAGCHVFLGPLDAGDSSAAVAWVRDGASAHLGASIGGGDLDGDGLGDLACGAFNGDGDHAGDVYLYYASIEGILDPLDADVRLRGSHGSELVGYPLRVSEDASGDGCPDLVLGAYGWEDDLGAVYLMQAGPS